MLGRLLKSLFDPSRGDGARREAALESARRFAQAGDLDAAATALAALPARLRDDPHVLHAQGLVAFQRGDLELAIRQFCAACAQLPGEPLFIANYGAALAAAGRPGEAESVLRGAVAAHPASAESWSGLAQVLIQRGGRGAAIEAAERAAALRPDDAQTHLLLGWSLLSKSRPDEALVHLRRALALDPGLLGAKFHGARAAASACDWSWPMSSTVSLLEHWAGNPGDPQTAAFQPFLAYEVPVSNVVRRAVAQHYADRIVARARHGAFSPPSAPPAPGPRLRVGYLSADFHNHPTMHLAAGLFELHDRSRFEVFAYSFGENDGSVYRQRATGAVEHFADVRDEEAPDTARRIGNDGIQVLVDLKGFTYLARPDILALRPAPVQASYLGYPGTMGSGLVDYLISDRIVTPTGCESNYGEKLALVPGSYQVNDRRQAVATSRPSRAECGLPESALVLCCFSVLYKVDPTIFEVWMSILRALPDAVLWLLAKPQVAEGNLIREAAARGVDASRLIFARFAPREAHLARLANADLFLDTRLVNAHTGASDALRAGVPLLTCAGDSFPSRVAASLVHAAGIGELAVDSLPAYEQLAVALGRDRAQLAALRRRLQEGLQSCPLFDTTRTTRNLERAYALMWEIHRQGQGAASFSLLER